MVLAESNITRSKFFEFEIIRRKVVWNDLQINQAQCCKSPMFDQ